MKFKRTNEKNRIYSTIEDVIETQKMGIDAFSHFRYLLNKNIPFQKETISALFEKRKLIKSKLILFIPDIGKSQKQNRIERK